MNENRDVFKQGNTLTDIDYKRKIIDEFLLTEESYQKVYDGDTHFHPERDNYWVYHNILETKLYEEEVRIFNKLKDYGLTENHLRARNYWLFRSEHFEALTALVLERDFTVRDALLELDMLSVEEAKAVKNGLRKAEVKGKNSSQIYLLEVNCRLKKEGIAQDFFNKVTIYDVDHAASEHAILNLIEKFLKDHNLHTVKHIKDITSYIEVFLLSEIVKKGYKSVLHRFIRFGVNINRESTIYPRCSLLMDACKQKHEDSVKLLLEFDADLFAKDKDGNTALMYVSSEAIARLIIEKAIAQDRLAELLEEKNTLGKTALMIKCSENNYKVVDLFLSWNANLLAQSNIGYTALMYAGSGEMCKHFLKSAEAKRQLQNLVTMVDNNGYTTFEVFANAGNADNAWAILPYEVCYRDKQNLKYSLGATRAAYLKYPNRSDDFDAICKALRMYVKVEEKKLIKIEDGKLMLESNPALGNFRCLYEYLLGNKFQERISYNKEEAIKRVLIEIRSLFENPKKCLEYSEYLSQMFMDFFKKKHGKEFPKLNPGSYKFQSFSSFFYPIPNENYQSISKKHALPEFLISFLRSYGLAKMEMASEWLGPVPHDVANQTVANGFFVTNSEFGLEAFHTSYAHVWQWAIAVYHLCVVNKSATLKYGMNQEHQLVMQDVLTGSVTLKQAPEFKQILWVPIFDANNYNFLTFYGPHSSMTALMQYGQMEVGSKCRAVSDYLIDKFCKAIRRFYHQTIKNSYFSNLSFNDFLNKLKDLILEKSFITADIFNEAIANEKLKNRKIEVNSEGQYAIVQKKYALDPVKPAQEKISMNQGRENQKARQNEMIINCLKLMFVNQLNVNTKNNEVLDNYWAPD